MRGTVSMEDEDKSREQLSEELDEARKRLSRLQRSDRELQRTKEALTLGVNALGVILENSNDLVVVLGADGTILFVSPSVERVTGLTPDELTGTDALDFIHPQLRIRVTRDVLDSVHMLSALDAMMARKRRELGIDA